MTGVASERPHASPAPRAHRAGARHDDRAFGHHQRGARVGRDDALVDEIVDGRRTREHRSRRDDGATLDDRAFVDAGVAAHQHLVFDDDGQRADRLDHAADLRRRR